MLTRATDHPPPVPQTGPDRGDFHDWPKHRASKQAIQFFRSWRFHAQVNRRLSRPCQQGAGFKRLSPGQWLSYRIGRDQGCFQSRAPRTLRWRARLTTLRSKDHPGVAEATWRQPSWQARYCEHPVVVPWQQPRTTWILDCSLVSAPAPTIALMLNQRAEQHRHHRAERCDD